MSLSEIVDEEYRLRVADLNGEPLRVEIVNVSYQGIEEMTPVLHFAGQARRLHLSQAHCRGMIRISGSATPPTWVGLKIVLVPVFIGGVWAIEIHPPGRRRLLPSRLPRLTERVAGWMMATTVVTLSILVAVWYISTNYSQIAATIEQLLP